MTYPGVIVRYLSSYALLLLMLCEGLGLRANALLFLGALLLCSAWPCLLYGRRNGHYLAPTEALHVIAGMTLIDMVVQIRFGNVLMPGTAPAPFVAASFFIVVGLHGALLTLVVTGVGHLLRRLGWVRPSPA